MPLSLRQLQIICGVGFAICAGGATYSVSGYMGLSLAHGLVVSLAPIDHRVEPTPGEQVADDKQVATLVLLLKSQAREAMQLHSLLTSTIEGARQRCLIETMLWTFAAILFVVLLFSMRGAEVRLQALKEKGP